MRRDPAMLGSRFERILGDRYWTEPWVTRALLQCVGVPSPVWEPAAGRGDIVRVLTEAGKVVLASDVDMSEFDTSCAQRAEGDFLQWSGGVPRVQAIVTNPPYDRAQEFVEQALTLMEMPGEDVRFAAFLLRSEFCHARSRRHLFGECPHYAQEILLTRRPRWDWWFRDRPQQSPRHNFSWFLWVRNYDEIFSAHPTQQFHYEETRR